MTPAKAKKLNIGDRVTVYNFGVHVGIFAGRDPVTTIQGRASVAEGWITVRLDDGRIWNGHPKLVEFESASPRRATA